MGSYKASMAPKFLLAPKPSKASMAPKASKMRHPKRSPKRSGAYRKAYQAYKSIRYDESLDPSERLVVELNMRIDFSKRFLGGKIDDRHTSYMKRVGSTLSTDQRLCLSLDAFRTISAKGSVQVR